MSANIQKIFVAGGGAWGTTVANLLAEKGLQVSIWAREGWLTRHIAEHKDNPKYLPGVSLHQNLHAAHSISEGMHNAGMIIYAIPAQSLRGVVQQTQPYLQEEVILLNLAKGIEEGTGLRCSEIVQQETNGVHPIAALSGPNIAYEIARKIPSKTVVSCNNYRYLGILRDLFSTPHLKVYENPDLVGTELGGALKNIVAIMGGIGDGLGFGVNTKAAIITRGLREMIKAGTMMGANPDTFFGLSGIGDLMATCLSPHSRNRTLGENLGRGMALEEAEAALNGRVAEGIRTAKALYEVKGELNLEMPIVDQLYRVLYKGHPPGEGYLAIWNPGEAHELN